VSRDFADHLSLYATDGARKYLNRVERQRVLAVMAQLPVDQGLFALTLAWTGARVSEVLALTPSSFQVESGIVAFRTLKRRKHSVREVPVPPDLMAALDDEMHLSARQRDLRHADQRLWRWSRVTAWRLVKKVMQAARVAGKCACPRGLRHAFGVGTLQTGVPLNITQRWLGHARISTTAIYAAASGPEEAEFAERFWNINGKASGRQTRTRQRLEIRRAHSPITTAEIYADACGAEEVDFAKKFWI
jgi:integrase